MAAPVWNPNLQYAGRATGIGGIGRPDQAGMPVYRPRTPVFTQLGQRDIYGNQTGRSVQAAANAQQPGAAQTNPAAGGATGGSIQTSITPGGIYSPYSTLQATNQAVATAQQGGGSWDWIRNMFARPGMSISSPGIAGQALPSYAGALAGGMQQGVSIPYQDMLANAQHLLSGQQAREGEALGWGRLRSTLGNAQQNAGISAILNVLNQFMG